ncbi:MAG: hypothetical protein QOF57_2442 [Frankiaceae bacterium]|nr:hypothetical protein [Frankiaceae bacterium]
METSHFTRTAHEQHSKRRYARRVATLTLLLRIETHNVAVGLPGSRRECVGPIVVTIAADPEQPIAARLTALATPADIAAATARMRALDVPERFEWIDELLPAQATAFRDAGFVVRRHPLLVLAQLQPPAERPGITVERVGPDSSDELASTAAAVGAIAFAYGAAGDRPADITEVELATALFSRGSELARTRASIADDRATLWLARLDDAPAATAWTIRHDGAAEIVGVGTVAAYRDRGLATAVTAHAAAAALADGADLVFLTAEDKRSAELYARLGFEVVANVCIAERMDADG